MVFGAAEAQDVLDDGVLAADRDVAVAAGTAVELLAEAADQPDLVACIVAAAQAGLDKGFTHYVPAPGIPELRTAVADFLGRTGRMVTTPDRVVVTPGAKPIMFFTILALCEEGDDQTKPALQAAGLPPPFKILVVPAAPPKTKPKGGH